MLNIRTLILSVALVVMLIFTVQLVTARTDLVSNPSSDPAAAPDKQAQSADLNNTHSVPSYRSQFGECFDVPIREVAACRSAGREPVQSSRPPLDECFDVSISELASCRNASQTSAP
jgi:hypothetical protein